MFNKRMKFTIYFTKCSILFRSLAISISNLFFIILLYFLTVHIPYDITVPFILLILSILFCLC